MESSDNDDSYIALDSMLEVSLVEDDTTTIQSAVPNVQNGNCNNKQKCLPADFSQMPHWNMDEEEEIFYQDLFEDLPQIRNLRLHCTKCDIHLGCYEVSKLYKHVNLGVLLCQECFDFYSSGIFPVGEDGSEIYCRWCGEGGTVICCSNCPNVFCKQCISHNFSKNVMSEILASSEWLCFVCNFRSLWEHRAVCRAAITYAATASKIKLQLANLSPRPGDDAKYCCSKDMDPSLLKPKLLRSSMPSNVTFAKFLNLKQNKVCQKEKIPAVTSTSANITISECSSSNQFQEITKVYKKSRPKNLTLGIPIPIQISNENQMFLKPGNIYQIQSSNINGLSPFPAVHNSLITNPYMNNVTNSALNTTPVAPFMRLPQGRAHYAIVSNSKSPHALQNQVPFQTFLNTVPHQTLQNPVAHPTLHIPVQCQTLQNLVPLQTLQNPVSCQIFQNDNTDNHTMIQQSTSVNFCKPSNTATPVLSKRKQNLSNNHILPVMNDDDDCQIISPPALNSNMSTNLSSIPNDNLSASSSINKKNNGSRIRVRTPAMLQSLLIGDSKTNKLSSSEHSEVSDKLFTSPDMKSLMLKAVLSDHMYLRTERNPQNYSLYNHSQSPLQLNNTEIMNSRIDSSTDSLENATKVNTLKTCINSSSDSTPETNSPQFKNCLPEIASLAKFMLSRALLLQEEINRMAHVDRSEFYFKNVPLFLENCKAGITKIEVNYIRERNKQLKNSGEPKEILLVHDDVVSIQPLCTEENSQPFCERDNSIKNIGKNDTNSSERKIKDTSSSTEAIENKSIKRKLSDNDMLSNLKKQKMGNVSSDVVVVLERLPKNILKKSESVNVKKEEDESKLNNNDYINVKHNVKKEDDESKLNNNDYIKCVSQNNCIRQCSVRLVRLNERNINIAK